MLMLSQSSYIKPYPTSCFVEISTAGLLLKIKEGYTPYNIDVTVGNVRRMSW
jgi:hypothetical protein